MKVNFTLKSVNQAVINLSKYLKSKGYAVPKPVLNEAFSKALSTKNWTVLKSLIENSSESLEVCLKPEHKKIIILKIDKSEAYVLETLVNVAEDVNCQYVLNSIFQTNGIFQIELDFSESSRHSIAMFFAFANKLVKDKCQVEEFHFWETTQRKENLLPFIMEKLAKI